MRKAKAIYSELALVRKADTTTWVCVCVCVFNGGKKAAFRYTLIRDLVGRSCRSTMCTYIVYT